MDDIEARELRYFIAVAEELNFTRAAIRLGMAQPPLSAAIGKLERKLGVRLLERTSRHVELTPAGRELFREGRVALEGLSAAVERTRRKADGHLTVAVKTGGGTDLLKRITSRCADDPNMPGIRILFDCKDGPAAAVRSGAADVAIMRNPFDRRGLDAEVLLTEPRVAALPAGHRLASRRALCRADLKDEPMPCWAGAADPASTAYWTGNSPSSAVKGPQISDMNQLLDVVALGQAVAYVPSSFARRHSGADIAFVPVLDLSPSEIVAAWPETSRSREVAGFVRAAAEVASDSHNNVAAIA